MASEEILLDWYNVYVILFSTGSLNKLIDMYNAGEVIDLSEHPQECPNINPPGSFGTFIGGQGLDSAMPKKNSFKTLNASLYTKQALLMHLIFLIITLKRFKIQN